jgi:ABC-2 type transport system permease protein
VPNKNGAHDNVKENLFSFKRMIAVTARILQQIRRDRRTLGMMVMMPALIIFIFGIALSGEVKNVPVAFDDSDAGYSYPVGPGINQSINLGEKLKEALSGDDRVQISFNAFDDGRSGVDSGTYYAAVRVPINFSENAFLLSHGSNAALVVDVYIDGTKPAMRASILGALHDSISMALGTSSVMINQEFAFGGVEYSGLDVSIPSVMGFVLTFLIMLISMLLITRENLGGTLVRLYATPLTALERLSGYMIALLFLGIMMSCVILGVGIGIFGAAVKGNIMFLLSVAVLYTLVHVFIAVFLSNFARNELQAVQMAPLIAFPSMALSGMLVPVNSLPELVQPLCNLVPLYWGNRLFEGIMLKGYGIGQLSTELIIIGGMAALFFALALVTVKDKVEA